MRNGRSGERWKRRFASKNPARISKMAAGSLRRSRRRRPSPTLSSASATTRSFSPPTTRTGMECFPMSFPPFAAARTSRNRPSQKSWEKTRNDSTGGSDMRTRLAVVLAICLFVFGVAQSRSHAADSSSPRKLRMAFTSLSGSMIPPWMARSAGIFAKHGLDVEVIATPSGVEGMNALIAGEVQFLQIAGSTTASAALGGADVMIVGTTLDTLVQNLMARPEIEKAEQLRGKTLGITRFGTSIDVGARIALRHFGLVPEKDVAIVQVGGMESMVAALQGNRIQAGILSYPAITQALKLGHHALLVVAALGIPYAFTGITTRGRLIRDDPDLVH